MFGAPSWLDGPVTALVTHGVALTILTWSVIALEFSLFSGLFAKKSYRATLLIGGVLFHVGIAFLHGLISFSVIVIGSLKLYLRPSNAEFSFGLLRRATRYSNLRALRIRQSYPEPVVGAVYKPEIVGVQTR